ncbi:MAG: PAS domain S-box protein [Deltaproteobacteria bacterium]|nr:PAS domain S-box protein [Deltaproteobacteria bacterium]
MKNKIPCWDFFQCKDKQCPAYKSDKLRCWLISGTHCRTAIEAMTPAKPEMCLGCEFFEMNKDADSMDEMLELAKQQLFRYRRLAERKDKELASLNLELSLNLTEVFEALERIASGDPDVRLSETSDLALVAKLRHMVNVTAQNISQIVELSHEFAISLAEHFDVLQRVSKGDLSARASGDSQVELLQALKHVTNEMIGNISQQITEREQAEEKVRQGEARLKTILDSIQTGVVVIDAETHVIVDVNPVAAELIGKPREDMVGRRCYNFICPVDQGMCPVSDLGEEIHKSEYVHINAEGNAIPVIKTVVPVVLNGRKHLIDCFVDITERKQWEESLKESEEKYRTIADSANEAIIIMDDNGNVSFWNPAAEKIFGYAAEEIRGRELHTTLGPSRYHQAYKEAFKKFRETGRGPVIGKTLELSAVRKDGTEFPIELSVSGIRIKGQWHAMGIIRDISEKHKAQEEKKELEARLQRTQKMEAIGTLAGGIAHDFNNILAAMMGYTELAIQDAGDHPGLQHTLGEVLTAGMRAKDLIKQILTFSRRGEEEKEPVQLALIVEESVKLLSASLPKSIEIRKNIKSRSAIVFANGTQIQQVVMNLCTNAGHAMRQKGGVLEVSLEDVYLDAQAAAGNPDLRPGEYERLCVSDTGDGIDRPTLERIFDPFFTTKGLDEGTGLGLSVVHGIVKGHGGAITVYSEPKKGTTFHVYLPKIESQQAPRTKTDTSVPMGDERILFVDDEQALVDIGKRTLGRLGYDVVARTSSIEALKLFEARPDRFDLVITDENMPNMTGTQLAGKLMSIRPDIPIILCTGYSQSISEQSAKAMGINGFVMKPMVSHDIAKIVRHVLDQQKTKHSQAQARILIVDDDGHFRSMLRQTLERAGYDPVEARDGEEGIGLFREHPFDLVITDIIMPGKEGLETIMELRKDYPDAKIIAMSGGGRLTSDDHLALAKASGAQAVLAKPFSKNQLLKVVGNLLCERPAAEKGFTRNGRIASK